MFNESIGILSLVKMNQVGEMNEEKGRNETAAEGFTSSIIEE